MPSVSTTANRTPPQNRQKLMSAIPAAQSSALRTMSTAGVLRPTLDAATVDVLVQAGYVRNVLGGYLLTDEGGFRSTMENVS